MDTPHTSCIFLWEEFCGNSWCVTYMDRHTWILQIHECMKLFKWAFAVLVKRISRTFHPQHPPDQIHLHPRYPFQMYCAFIVDSCGDNAETINLSVTNNLSQRKENTPHMTFHEMTHEDSVLLYSIMWTPFHMWNDLAFHMSPIFRNKILFFRQLLILGHLRCVVYYRCTLFTTVVWKFSTKIIVVS